MIGPALLEGLKARDMTAWGEAPGPFPRMRSSALKGRGRMGGASFVSAFQALGDFRERINRPFWPGYHMTGLRPSDSKARFLQFSFEGAVKEGGRLGSQRRGGLAYLCGRSLIANSAPQCENGAAPSERWARAESPWR